MTLFDVDVPAVGEKLEPVLLEIRQECAFQRSIGCATCGRPKKWRGHFGAPPSINPLGSGDPRMWQHIKEQWSELLEEELRAAGLRRGLSRLMVEGEAVFPQRAGRDQGNFRVIIEKALGDVLKAGGWLPDDTWDRYEFGNLVQRIQPGVSATRLMLFPTAQ
jgi:hypothetical protein